MENKKLHYGYIMVAAVFINMLICGGILYGASGVFIGPVTKSLNIGIGKFTLYMTIQGIAQAILVLLAPKLLGKFPFKTLNAISAIVAGVGFGMMGFAKGVGMLYVGGVLVGFGTVFLSYLSPGVLLPRWFTSRLGIMMAVATSGIALGGVVFNPIVAALVNSKGMLGFSEGWRSAYVILGALIIFIILPIALFVLKERPEDKGLWPVGYDASAQVADGQTVVTRKVTGVSKARALKSTSFIFLVLMALCFTLPSTINQFFPNVAENSAGGGNLVGVIGSVASAGALIGGFILGAVNDKFGGRGGAVLGGVVGAVGLIILLLLGNSGAMLLCGAALFGVFYQLNMVQLPAMVRTMYGDLDYDKIFPVAAAVAPWVGAVSYSLWGFLRDATGSYNLMFTLGAVLAILTAVTAVLAVAASKKLPHETGEA